MTCLRSSLFRRISNSRALLAAFALACLASACSTAPIQPDSEDPASLSPTRNRIRQRGVWSQFEWAVQYYEAGNYREALRRFRGMQTVGANVADFDLIPFYLGMSHFNLREYPNAVAQLERFLQSTKDRRETQEARMALLLSFENTGAWERLLGLAAETDRLTLFHYNRALLKLVWARALRERGEILGARTVLKDAGQFLDESAREGFQENFLSDPNRDLWGRYHATSVMIRESECASLVPQELASTSGGKKKAPAKPRLYRPWLEARTDCLIALLGEAADDLFAKEGVWSGAAAHSLETGIAKFGELITTYVRSSKKSLQAQRELESNARSQLYRLLGQLDSKLKSFKKQGLKTDYLESARKRVDRLLVSNSATS